MMICWNNKSILQCPNYVIIRFYAEIQNVIKENHIILNFHLEELIWHLDNCASITSFDIYEFIYSKEDFELFLKILKEVLERMDDDYYAKAWLKSFCRKLFTVYKTFEPDSLLVKSFKTFDFFVKHPELPAAAITYNRRYLLICPRELLCLLFEKILSDVIHTSNVLLPNNISKIINHLLNSRTRRIDISDYTNSKEEFIFFANLMRKTIDITYMFHPTDANYRRQFYETFYKNLLETIDNFPYFTPEESKFTTLEIAVNKYKKAMADFCLKNNIVRHEQTENND